MLVTPVRAPTANAYAKRWVDTVRAECLDWLLLVARGHLEQVLRVYIQHYNRHRPHRALQLQAPDRPAQLTVVGEGQTARCSDVTCSAVSCMSTGELHETRLRTPQPSDPVPAGVSVLVAMAEIRLRSAA